MCGIFGFIGDDKVDSAKVLKSIKHRGPDNQKYFQKDNIFLGHTRLSIQDLSENGNQPMFSNDGRYVIIFNGEIYNHLEIREQIKNDFNFKSTGDTETVLYAFIKYGSDFLKKLNGIFALSIYDIQEKELFIARDQFGVKPLYLYKDATKFIFSSELKTFLAFDINKSLDPKALNNYLSFLWSPGELVPFSHVKKLLPGYFLQFKITDFEKCTPIPYYQINFNGIYSTLSEELLIEQLDQLLTNAVQSQMLSDVPVGFFLSGGLDSSLVVAIAKKLYPEKKFPCFTIDMGNWSEGSENFTNDLYYAKKVAELLDVELNIVKADINILDHFDEMIWHLDEPQADAAPLNVLKIAKLAREKGIKVLLGGTGGDDIFSGYRRHQALNFEKYFKFLPTSFGSLIQKAITFLPNNNAFTRRLRKISINLNKSTIQRMSGYFNWLPNEKLHSLFSKEWQEKLRDYNPNLYLEQLSNEIPYEKNLLNQMLYWEIKSFLVDHNLNYTDKMGMAVGVEARVPFLDMELVEFSLTIPPELKMKGNETKYLLKKVAERYLPMDVIYRPKTGFGAPVRKWITEDLDEMIHYRLSPERLKKRGIFNPQKIWELINDNKNGKIDASYSIWALLAIDSWMNQFVYNKIQNNEGENIS
jgi:asparagine synthase (glutamine-hydrolysing)